MSVNIPLYDKLSLFLLSFFSFLVMPYTFTSCTLDPTLHLRFVIWSFLSLALGSLVFTKNKARQEITFASMSHRGIFWIGGLFLLLAAFSLHHSINISEGIFAWLSIFLAGSFFLICSLLFCRYPNYLLTLNHWAVVAAVGLVFIGLAGRYWQNDPVMRQSFFFGGIMINKNLYASSLFMLVPYVVHCVVSGQKIWSRTAAALLPILCFVIILSQSRAVWLAMIFAALPVIIMAIRYPVKKSQGDYDVKGFSRSIALFAGSIFLAMTWLYLASPATMNKSNTVRLRINLWNSTVQMIQDELFFGVGPGQWRLLLPKYDAPLTSTSKDYTDTTETRAQRPHNDLLWVTAETGIVGGACYLLFFGMVYYYAFKVTKKASYDQKILTLLMIYGISGYLIISMFSYPRERPLHGLLLMLMAATVVSTYHRLYPTSTQEGGRYMPILKCTMLIILTVCCLDGGLRLYSETKLKSALVAREQGQWQQVITHIDKAFLAAYSIDPFGVPLPWYQGMAHYNLNMAPAALDDFSRSIMYHPNHTHSLNNLRNVKKMTDKNGLLF